MFLLPVFDSEGQPANFNLKLLQIYVHTFFNEFISSKGLIFEGDLL